jgi:predicted O-linked N-acetylglucosamine transferase (SPINDLY family)
MGVPLLTMAGRHAGGVSLVRQVGHPEWVAKDSEDYLRLAQEFCRQGIWPLAKRQQLRNTFTQSPANRPQLLVQALEKAVAALKTAEF